VIQEKLSPKPSAFLMLPHAEHFNVFETAFKIVVERERFCADKYRGKKLKRKPVNALSARKERFVGQGYCQICQLCWFSDIGIAELASVNTIVVLEVSLIWGFGKEIIFMLDISRIGIDSISFDLRNYMYATYDDIERLGRNLESKIQLLLKTL
jgi:hypothetical protein